MKCEDIFEAKCQKLIIQVLNMKALSSASFEPLQLRLSFDGFSNCFIQKRFEPSVYHTTSVKKVLK